ncbi:pentatricopeptide repeat-containing protein-like [Iris pallida]|uniref:Pentatricopeptide repeat-containing protein-like n=1 Tax=Iris pallida TaxID=29817 RepID=A0AAX6GG37_IRIPA|nr:pentatricopeptide repeat-containing protein-like [Iris pallida]
MSFSPPLPPSSPILSLPELSTYLSELHQSHALIIKTGLIRHPLATVRLLSSATASSSLSYADSLFDRIPSPSTFSYNILIRAHARSADPQPALRLFLRMLPSPARPDNFTFPFLLKACTSLLALPEALQLHALVLKSGSRFTSDVFVQNSLIHFYAAANLTEDAYKLFDRMPNRDAVTWNSIISVYVSNRLIGPARALFDEMPERSLETWNFMISGYVNAGLLDGARDLFDRMPMRDVVSWNAMITGCVRGGLTADAIELFQGMLGENVRPDECTLVNVLSSCARSGALGQGEWVRAYIDRNGVEIRGFLATALVDMYSKCGCIDKALRVFEDARKKDVSTWNAIIDGLSSHGYEEHALRLFHMMAVEGFVPNAVTFVSVLSACSHAGLLDKGRYIFKCMVKDYKIEPTVEHYGCMVDLFGRAAS